LKTVLSASRIKEVSDFVDVGEYGVALETAFFIIDEEKKPISIEARDLIDNIGRMMMMHPSRDHGPTSRQTGRLVGAANVR
jgi:hypothetical protein